MNTAHSSDLIVDIVAPMKDMPTARNSRLLSCIKLMVRPLARFCVSRGVKLQDFIELSTTAFVSAAKEKLAHEGKEISHSRVGMMIGLQRPEVKRLLSRKAEKQPKDVITQILGQWERDRRFLDGRKRPRPLEAQSKTGEFAKLVRAVSKDLNPHTVRYELERLGLICGKNS